MQIFYSLEFRHKYKKLSVEVKDQAKEKERIFRNNPFDQQLATHRLKGKFGGFWSFSVDFQYRIIFKFLPDKSIRFYTIGGHSIYK